jgi:glucose/arabinose dehydrogenase
LSTVVALLAAAGAACAFAQSAPQQTKQPPQTQQQPPPTQQQPPQSQPQPERPRSAAAGGSATAPANAAQDPEARRIFRELDRNGDGYLSRDELSADRARSENWAAVDRNGDGRIAPSEFSTLKSAR